MGGTLAVGEDVFTFGLFHQRTEGFRQIRGDWDLPRCPATISFLVGVQHHIGVFGFQMNVLNLES